MNQPPDDDIFDNYLRAIATHTTRRAVLLTSVRSLATLLLSSMGIRHVRAATCLCNGGNYDPEVQCCTPAGIQPKHPVADLASCPSRVAAKGYTCVANGCGAAGGWKLISQYGSASFLGCCNSHDCCFGACLNDRHNCNLNFSTCMHANCDGAYPPNIATDPKTGISYDLNLIKRTACGAVANAYFVGVETNIGTAAYVAAQQAGCDCCTENVCDDCESRTDCNRRSLLAGGTACTLLNASGGFCTATTSCSLSNHVCSTFQS